MIELINATKKFARENRNNSGNHYFGGSVLIKAERILKKSAPGKCYKQTVQNISYFNKEKIFVITNKRNIDYKTFYWLANAINNKYLNKRF